MSAKRARHKETAAEACQRHARCVVELHRAISDARLHWVTFKWRLSSGGDVSESDFEQLLRERQHNEDRCQRAFHALSALPNELCAELQWSSDCGGLICNTDGDYIMAREYYVSTRKQ